MSEKLPKYVPTNLKHKPVYAINGYAVVDSSYEKETDVAALSIGRAQWTKEKFIAGVKVWRRKEHWLRQSEETTVTRALDMAMLIIKVLDKVYNGQDFESVRSIYGSLKVEEVEVDPAIVEGLEVFLKENKEDITAHVDILYEALKKYKENTAATEGKTLTYTR